jgi:CHAT domain-containing protein/tetratricopeptide (TPR) repeat protein
MGDFARAEPLLLRALEIDRKLLGENCSETANCLNSLAALYASMEDYAKAEPLARQSLEIRKRIQGDAHADTLLSLNNLAEIDWLMGDVTKATDLYRQALEIEIKVSGQNNRDYAQVLDTLASLIASEGDYSTAETAYRQAIEIRKNVLGEKHPDTAQSLSNLAALYHSWREDAKAEPLSRQALEIDERHLADTCRIQSERQKLLLAGLLRVHLDWYLTIGASAGVSASDLYRHVLAWKGAVFLRQVASRALRRRPDLKPRFDELLSVDVRLSTLALRGPGQIRRDAWEEQVAGLSRRKESLERDLSLLSAEFSRQQALLNCKPEELQRVLPRESALIDVLEYRHFRPSAEKKGRFETQRRLVAFVVRCDRPIVRIELGPVGPLAQAAERWRRAILHEGGSEDGGSHEIGRAEFDAGLPKDRTDKWPQEFLKRAIWSPLQESLAGVRIALISPDGVLNQIPFAALPGEKAGSYLIEDIKIAVIPVPRMLLWKDEAERRRDEPEKPGAQSLLIVGDVDYGGSPGQVDGALIADVRAAVRGSRSGALHFPELESTRSELATIRDSFEKDFPDGKATPLRGHRATESEFRREAPKHRWLHLATHGFFAPAEIASALAPAKEDPLRRIGELTRTGISGSHPGLLSGLALCGANTPAKEGEDDGILTAVEVGRLDLERADLVVLSACETGLGSVAGGEGVLGLQRAFQLAGAKTTVASLWKIPDRATMQLMQRFYENLWDKKLSKLDALREAQLWMLKEGRTRGLDLEDNAVKKPTSSRLPPRYWAAFVLSGDWR